MTATARPRNPLRTYAFRLRVDDRAVAGLRKVSGLTMSVQAHETWEGGNSLHRYAQPDRATWEPITLEQGLALDDTLERWARAAIEFLHTGSRPSEAVKRNVVLEVWDPQSSLGGFAGPGDAVAEDVGAAVTGVASAMGFGGVGAAVGSAVASALGSVGADRRRSYEIFNAWVSRYEAIPALDAMGNEVGLLLVELTHEGWRPHPPA